MKFGKWNNITWLIFSNEESNKQWEVRTWRVVVRCSGREGPKDRLVVVGGGIPFPMSRAIHGLLRRRDGINHHLHRWSSPSSVCRPAPQDLFSIPSSSSCLPSHAYSLFLRTPSKFFSSRSFAAKPTSSIGTLSRFFYSSEQNPLSSMIRASRKYYASTSRTPQTYSSRRPVIPKQGDNYAGLRSFSFKSSNLGKVNGGFAKKVIDKPVTAVRSAFSRYSEAIGLQIEAFFKRNYLFLLGAAGVVVCALLWRIMFGIANAFIGLSEGMAKYGFLALSSAIVAFAVSSFNCPMYCILLSLCCLNIPCLSDGICSITKRFVYLLLRLSRLRLAFLLPQEAD